MDSDHYITEWPPPDSSGGNDNKMEHIIHNNPHASQNALALRVRATDFSKMRDLGYSHDNKNLLD